MPTLATALLLVATADPPDTHRGWNSAAETVAERSRTLGIDFEERGSKAPHPTAEDARSFAQAGFGPWLDSQVQAPDDTIAEPPAVIREFLRDRQDAVWSLVEAPSPTPTPIASRTPTPPPSNGSVGRT